MKKTFLFAMIPVLLASCQQGKKEISVVYPETKTVEQSDEYFGLKINDPYRWLEDDRAPEVGEWVKQQNEVTQGYLSQIPYRNTMEEALTKMWNFPKLGVPQKHGEYYLLSKNDGVQNQAVLYIKKGLNGEEKVLIDPNSLSAEGTVALSSYSVSKDQKYIAYMLSSAGSDWSEIKVKDLEGKDLNDHIQWVKFSGISWYKDGFFYSAYGKPEGSVLSSKNEFHKVFYHKIGTSQNDDALVFEDKNYALRNYSAGVSDDEKYLFVYGSEGTSGNNLLCKELGNEKAPFKTIVSDFNNDYGVVGNIGSVLYIQTNFQAPNYRLVKVNIADSKIAFENLIPNNEQDVLEFSGLVGDKLVLSYLHNANNQLFICNTDGSAKKEIKLPELGTVSGIKGEQGENEMFYHFSSFTDPGQIIKMDVSTGESSVYHKTELSFQASEYVTEQVFYASKDGVKVPMFIVYKKGIQKDGNNPLLLYGYGGFNISLTPSFSISNMLFLENGGIYAVANLRGGGEFGKNWHEAGTKLQKQNVFNDFISAAEYLIENKYTSSSKLAIRGGSNGGLLVGACMTQRPELFKVAIPAVGVLDMLRFHKFTIGWAWVGDYGSSEDSAQFHYLLAYSPLHNVKEGICYPATLVTTGDHDDRVVPAHSFKFAAALQAAQAKENCKNPILIRIETNAGHGAGKPTSKYIQEAADMWAFTFHNLGMKFKNPSK